MGILVALLAIFVSYFDFEEHATLTPKTEHLFC
jgi:hypothetical protein